MIKRIIPGYEAISNRKVGYMLVGDCFPIACNDENFSFFNQLPLITRTSLLGMKKRGGYILKRNDTDLPNACIKLGSSVWSPPFCIQMVLSLISCSFSPFTKSSSSVVFWFIRLLLTIW
jgi:hypothetical protein